MMPGFGGDPRLLLPGSIKTGSDDVVRRRNGKYVGLFRNGKYAKSTITITFIMTITKQIESL
jgi:hypothetical protein